MGAQIATTMTQLKHAYILPAVVSLLCMSEAAVWHDNDYNYNYYTNNQEIEINYNYNYEEDETQLDITDHDEENKTLIQEDVSDCWDNIFDPSENASYRCSLREVVVDVELPTQMK